MSNDERRDHYGRLGFPKRPYSLREARRLAARFKQDFYLCRVCRAWHLRMRK